MTAQSCPERTLLQSLLTGTSENGEHAALVSHLDECLTCRRALDELAGARDVSATALADLDLPSQSDEPKLQGALDALKATPPDEQPPGELDFALDFLEPSDDPAQLGRFASYEITEELGRGGHGVVLKGFDPALHRVVAVKVLAPALASNGTARKRFDREARAAAAVSHDHVVTIHAVDEHRRLPYLVMQYVSGMSLQEKIHRDGPLEIKEILRIGMQIASGLAAAHAQGNVHRDIKPSNILLENGVERVKITDFGLARAMDDAALTQSGVVAGTPQYMAPEQARGEPLDHRADLFSLGSVLYAMCTGRPPFRTDTTMAVLRKVSDETPTPIRQINADVPDWLAEIVTRLHAKDPEQRYQTAAEVAGVLGRHLEQLQHPSRVQHRGDSNEPDAVATTASAETRERVAHSKPPRTRWLAAAAVVLVALALGITEATGVTEVTDFVATVLRIRTPEGTLVVKVDDPAIEVTVEDGGKAITLTGAGPHTIRLTPGRHQVQATRNGQPLPTQWVTVSRGGKQVVSVSLEPAQADSSTGLLPLQPPLPPIGVPGTETTPAHTRELLRLRATLVAHGGSVESIAFSQYGKTLATYGADQTIKVWDAATQATLHTLTPFSPLPPDDTSDKPLLVAFTPDVRHLVSAGTSQAHVWEAQTGKLLSSFDIPARATSATLAPDGIELVTVGKIMRRWDTVTGTRRELLDLEPELPMEPDPTAGRARTMVHHARFAPRGDRLAAVHHFPGTEKVHATYDFVALWDTSKSYIPRGLRTNIRQTRINDLAFSPDARRLVTAGMLAADRAGARVWAVAHQSLDRRIPGSAMAETVSVLRNVDLGEVLCVAWSPTDDLIATGSADNGVRLWNPGNGAVLAAKMGPADKGHLQPVHSIAFSPDGKLLAAGGNDGTVKLWDVARSAGEEEPRQEQDTSEAREHEGEQKRVEPDHLRAKGRIWEYLQNNILEGGHPSKQALAAVVAHQIQEAKKAVAAAESKADREDAEQWLNQAMFLQRELQLERAREEATRAQERRARVSEPAAEATDDQPLAADLARPVRRLPAWRRHIEDGLSRRITFVFDDTPLQPAAEWIGAQLKANVVLDRKALSEKQIDVEAPVTVLLKDVPLEAGLNRMLEPLGMEYLLRDEALVLTTREKADAYLETQVYRVGHLLPPTGPGGKAPFDPKYWQDLLTTLIDPGTWSTGGGLGVFKTDDARALLIISQTQSIHRKIAKLLEDMKAAPASGGRQSPDPPGDETTEPIKEGTTDDTDGHG